MLCRVRDIVNWVRIGLKLRLVYKIRVRVIVSYV